MSGMGQRGNERKWEGVTGRQWLVDGDYKGLTDSGERLGMVRGE